MLGNLQQERVGELCGGPQTHESVVSETDKYGVGGVLLDVLSAAASRKPYSRSARVNFVAGPRPQATFETSIVHDRFSTYSFRT